MDMFKIGCHLSASKGFLAMGKTAVSIGANTFQFFTRNPRGGAAKDIDENDINEIVKNYNVDISPDYREIILNGYSETLSEDLDKVNECYTKILWNSIFNKPKL